MNDSTHDTHRAPDSRNEPAPRVRHNIPPSRSNKTAVIIASALGIVVLVSIVAFSILSISKKNAQRQLEERIAAEQQAYRDQCDSLLREAAIIYKTGAAREAYTKAMEAQSIAKHVPDAFTPAKIAEVADAADHYLGAHDILTRAQDFADQASGGFAGAVKKLDNLLANTEIASDLILSRRIRALKQTAILTHVRDLIKNTTASKETLTTLDTLRSQYAGELSKENLAELDKAIDAYAKIYADALFGEAQDVFVKIPELLKVGRIQAAFDLPVDFETRLRAQPERVAKPVLAEYTAILDAIRFGKDIPAGRITVDPAGRHAFETLNTLKGILDAAPAIAGDAMTDLPGAKDKIAELKKAVTAAAGAGTPADEYCQKKIDEKAGKIDQLIALRTSLAEAAKNDYASRIRFLIFRMAESSSRVRYDPLNDINDTDKGFVASMKIDNTPLDIQVDDDTFRDYITVAVKDREFRVDVSNVLFRDVLTAMKLARRMRSAEPAVVPPKTWTLAEGPSFPIAIAADGSFQCFFKGELVNYSLVKNVGHSDIDAFIKAARALHDGIESDKTIPADLRQAFDAVLRSAYGKLDPRDHLDRDFCRRIIAGGYLEANTKNLGKTHLENLARYRKAFSELKTEDPVFTVTLSNGTIYTALTFGQSQESVQSTGEAESVPGPASGQTVYNWRIYNPKTDRTIFARPLPGREIFAVYLEETFPGKHDDIPTDLQPARYVVTHTLFGKIASYTPGDDALTADEATWNRAALTDFSMIQAEGIPNGAWYFPPHLPILDARGVTTALVTRQGVLRSPDFSAMTDPEKRVTAQDAYITRISKMLVSPGELGFFFRYLAQYCLDSPIPENYNLLGSFSASSDYHQTVYQFLDRKIGGAFVGDCDDLAEFYQAVTRRQGKLSYVFSLPQHAACGYVEHKGKDDYDIVFVHTGPPYIFTGKTLDEVVEKGVMSFSEDQGWQFNVAAVPFLFRFANEQTRTPYWLSDRILVDKEYADLLIRVQSYWHYHYYYTGITAMENRLKTDKDISNYTELAGLYRAVNLFDKAVDMNRQALKQMKRHDLKVKFDQLVDIGYLQHRAGHDSDANKTFDGIQSDMDAMIEKIRTSSDQANTLVMKYMKLFSIRLQAAGTLLDMDEPVKAFQFIQMDIRIVLNSQGKLNDPLLRTLVGIRRSIGDMERAGQTLSEDATQVKQLAVRLINATLKSSYFQKDDSFTDILQKYGLIADYLTALWGKDKVIALLLSDGSYPTENKDHTQRGDNLTDEDVAWIRIVPSVYMGLVTDMYDPTKQMDLSQTGRQTAIELINAMMKGVSAGSKIGSMTNMAGFIVTGHIIRAILNDDIKEIRTVFKDVRAKDWSRHYDDAATAFGHYCGLLPLKEFPKWMRVFHKYFPGKQHYFKVAYRAIDFGYYDHALAAAKETARFFPDVPAMQKEYHYMKTLVKELKRLKAERLKKTDS